MPKARALLQIGENLGFSHSTQAKRELRKGLDILLKFYNEHNIKKVVVI